LPRSKPLAQSFHRKKASILVYLRFLTTSRDLQTFFAARSPTVIGKRLTRNVSGTRRTFLNLESLLLHNPNLRKTALQFSLSPHLSRLLRQRLAVGGVALRGCLLSRKPYQDF
jgi:hypothetical protein